MLTLAVARTVLTGIEAEARRIGVAVSAAVVDSAGLPILLVRMDGAIPVTAELALGKAFSAVFWRRPTAELEILARDRSAFFEALLSIARRPLVPSAGGLVVVRDGNVEGAVGVSGARSAEEDVICAQAGLLAAGLPPF